MEISSTQKIIRTVLAFGAVVITLLVLFGGYGAIDTLFGYFGKPAIAQLPPSGHLLVSFGTVSTTTGVSNGIHTVTVDASNGTGVYLPTDQLATGPALTLQYSVSSDNNYAVFLATPYKITAEEKYSAGNSLAVYRADISSVTDYESNLRALQSAQPVSMPSNADYFRQSPVVAPSKAVLYASVSNKTFELANGKIETISANNWNIMMVDPDGTVHAVTQGLAPKWVDATHFAYLRDDGLYLYDLTTKTEQQIKPWNSPVTVVNGFDVSDDGQRVAFSDPASGTFLILHALDWKSGVVPVTDDLSGIAVNNLAFSPYNDYLAALTITATGGSSGITTSAIQYFSLTQHTFINATVPFDHSVVKSIYISDWRR